jgi:hypothetical protein
LRFGGTVTLFSLDRLWYVTYTSADLAASQHGTQRHCNLPFLLAGYAQSPLVNRYTAMNATATHSSASTRHQRLVRLGLPYYVALKKRFPPEDALELSYVIAKNLLKMNYQPEGGQRAAPRRSLSARLRRWLTWSYSVKHSPMVQWLVIARDLVGGRMR